MSKRIQSSNLRSANKDGVTMYTSSVVPHSAKQPKGTPETASSFNGQGIKKSNKGKKLLFFQVGDKKIHMNQLDVENRMLITQTNSMEVSS